MSTLNETVNRIGMIANSVWLGLFTLTLLFTYPKIHHNFNILGKITVCIYFCLVFLRTFNSYTDFIVSDPALSDLIMHILSTVFTTTSFATLYFFIFQIQEVKIKFESDSEQDHLKRKIVLTRKKIVIFSIFGIMAGGHIFLNFSREIIDYLDYINGTDTKVSPIREFFTKFFRVGRCVIDCCAFLFYASFLIFYFQRKRQMLID